MEGGGLNTNIHPTTVFTPIHSSHLILSGGSLLAARDKKQNVETEQNVSVRVGSLGPGPVSGSISGFHLPPSLPHKIPHIPHSSECNCGSICPRPLYTPPPPPDTILETDPESEVGQAPDCARGRGE